MDTGYGIYFDPEQGTVGLRQWYEWDQRGPINEMSHAFAKERPTVVELFLDGDILEVFVDGCRSLVGRIPENATGSAALLAQDGPVAFGRIVARTIE